MIERIYMLKQILLCVTIVLTLLIVRSALANPTGKVTVKAIDDRGVPLQSADVRITFKFAKEGGWGLNTKAEHGLSDMDGLFSAMGTGMASISISARKKGYYKSGKGYKFSSKSIILNRWEPWNPTFKIVLKQKRNPVPMYRGGVGWGEVPILDKNVGYDLEKADWVAPYGEGIISDFVFNFQGEIRGFREYDLKMILSFSNVHDGIQEYYFDKDDQSYFKWPFQAPEGGYKEKITKSVHKVPGETETNMNNDINYLFRVRTEVDRNGKIISARYGKVPGEFELSPDGDLYKFRFSYFFNPDGTRNLEEDPKRNLFDKK